jgi:glycine/D-amino acid oxidase-like deaminating enzyme
VPAHPGNIVVVGAGVFGATAALELSRRGHVVTLLDRGPVPHEDASSTDISKMIRMDYGADVFYHELAEVSLEGWDRWNAEWPRPLYHEDQFLVLSAGPMSPGGFEYESHRVLTERGYEPERIDGSELARRCPAWNALEYADGYLSPRGGWAESGAVVTQLLELCAEAGVQTRPTACTAFLTDDTRILGVQTAEGDILADEVVVCAGAWTPALVPWLGPTLKTIAQPVLHFGVEDPDDFRGPRFPPFAADIAGTGWYGFPALDDGRVKLGHHGHGYEVNADEKGRVEVDHIAHARAFLAKALPSLAEAPVVGSRVCLYCDSLDGDLLIDRDPDREGLVVAAGGSGHGFKFAPVIGEIVADVVEGRSNPWRERFRWRTGGKSGREEARLQNGRDP